jgi:hypothetical protein
LFCNLRKICGIIYRKNRTNFDTLTLSKFSLYYVSSFAFILVVKALLLNVSSIQVAMCNFQTIKDAADVAIATMLSGIQVCLFSC